ncbi:TonB-dependent hemoglobin/transferrin/lactoferrin family receptor [Corallincola holothuriorum]|uniref:TonB-dependent hemoglobin/transferrin/lactoferrin family receptor n=1 Tax=Corallincola holothuriorum TaxID=2282215 RepID=A0A368N4Y3_9GAMM|nr:TonB-dependent hemoglobin/transferrin/lactoferrin family receptor [Corallincola holothuriorum]RCU45612.1 TonB-dependent hemoglobin/transferrin/lactoferrin family receptor [Corallincola holothuriorum]
MQLKPLAILIGSMFSASSFTATAADEQQNDGLLEIKPVVVSATRMAQEVDEVSRPIAVVEKEEIDTIQPQSVAQVLKNEPNISVSGGPRANNQSVNIRGLTGNKVLQTVDGVRQVFESGHRPSYFLDPELLQSVEAIKGPSSSLWGSGAVGGVVAQNTVSAGDLLTAEQDLGGFVKQGFNWNNDQSTTTGALAGRTDSLDWLLSGYYRDSNDIELGSGESLAGSASRDKGVLAKTEWQIDDAQSLAFNLRTANSSGNVPSNGSADFNGTSNFLINRDQDTTNLSADYRIDTDSPLINAQVMAYWNNVEMDEYRISDGRSDSTDLDVYGLNLNNLSLISVEGFGDISLLYGVDGYREEFSASRQGDDRPTPPEADTDVWGGFVQANIPFAESWQLEVGGRYDYFSTEAKNLGQDRSDNDFSPSAALIWQTTNWLQLTLRHDRAFRAPSSEEMYSTGTHFCMGPGFCNTFVPNPDLKAEQAANTELMAQMNFAGVFTGADSLNITTSIFENKVDDFIEQIVTDPSFAPPFPDPGTTTWVNVDEATIKGFEIAADYHLDSFKLGLAYGIVRGEDDNSSDDLTNIPADTFNADISYGFWADQITTGVRLTHAREQDKTQYDGNSDGTTYGSYTVGDIYASWTPSSIKALKIDLTLNNVTDKDYRQAWSELDEAGREVILSTKYSF